MKRLLVIGFAACAVALAPSLSASAMPVATPGVLAASDADVIQVKGGKWKFKKPHHYKKWKHHHRHW